MPAERKCREFCIDFVTDYIDGDVGNIECKFRWEGEEVFRKSRNASSYTLFIRSLSAKNSQSRKDCLPYLECLPYHGRSHIPP